MKKQLILPCPSSTYTASTCSSNPDLNLPRLALLGLPRASDLQQSLPVQFRNNFLAFRTVRNEEGPRKRSESPLAPFESAFVGFLSVVRESTRDGENVTGKRKENKKNNQSIGGEGRFGINDATTHLLRKISMSSLFRPGTSRMAVRYSLPQTLLMIM